MSNIYSKMQKVRCELSERSIEKTGNNKFANFKYFELGDFLPIVTALLESHNLCSHVSFTKDEATLIIINSENPDKKMTFTSPMSTACVAKNGNEVQNLGAVQTYLRRYLYVAAFEIVENDGLDAVAGKEELQPSRKTKTNVKIKKIEGLLKIKDVDANAVMQFVKTTFKVDELKNLNEKQCDDLIDMLVKKADRSA